MRYWAHFRLTAAVMALIAVVPIKVLALDMPGPSAQEVLVKSTLVTLNDAVATENFTVFHAKLSKPFRDQFPPEKLQAIFKNLIDKHAVFDAVVAERMISDEDARIDEKGVLKLKGHFETTPKRVKYELGFIQSEGAWKLSGVSIDIE
jgi:hypothetical protein